MSRQGFWSTRDGMSQRPELACVMARDMKSRMRRESHVRFSGEGDLERGPPYPTIKLGFSWLNFQPEYFCTPFRQVDTDSVDWRGGWANIKISRLLNCLARSATDVF
jgi:hypothetical protein